MSLSIKQTAIDLLSKLGLEVTDPTTASALQQQDVIVAINGAMQYLQTAGQDFFTRQISTIAVSSGTQVYTLAGSVQDVIGPVRFNSIPLDALTSKGQIDQYDRIFGGLSSFGASPGTPRAFYAENLRAGTVGDINQINIWLAPIPNANGTLSIEVVNDAPSYSVSNIGDAVILPVAQNYTESVFLPVARMLITRSSLFSRPDILPLLTEDYTRALATLERVGGFPPSAQPASQRLTLG